MITKQHCKNATLLSMVVAGWLSLTSHPLAALFAASLAIALAAAAGPIIPIFPLKRSDGLKPDSRMLMLIASASLTAIAALVSSALSHKGLSLVLWLLSLPMVATPYAGQLKEKQVAAVKTTAWKYGPLALAAGLDLLVLANAQSIYAVSLSTLAVFLLIGSQAYLKTHCDPRFVWFAIDRKRGANSVDSESSSQSYACTTLPSNQAIPLSPLSYYDHVVELVLKHFLGDTEAFQNTAQALRKNFRTYRQAGIALRRAILALNDPHTWLLDARESAAYQRQMDERANDSWQIVGFTKDNPWFAVLHVDSFSSVHVADGVRHALDEINAISGTYEPAAIILDLRGNPGGMAFEALKVFDLFVEEGQFLRAEGTQDWRLWLEGNQAKFEVDGMLLHTAPRMGNLTGNKPILVLVDSESASASEALACALKEHRGAKIVGERTWGKETGGIIIPVGYGTTLLVSVARMLPEGYRPDGNGIEPEFKAGMSFSRDYQLTSACHIANAMVWTDRLCGQDARLRNAAAYVMHRYFDLLGDVGTGRGVRKMSPYGGPAHVLSEMPKEDALSELKELLRRMEATGMVWYLDGNFDSGIEVSLMNPESGKGVTVCLPRLRTAEERKGSFGNGGTLRAQFLSINDAIIDQLRQASAPLSAQSRACVECAA